MWRTINYQLKTIPFPMRLPLLLLLALTAALSLHAAPLEPILLYPNGAPGALGDKDDDKPTLTAFLPAPDKATGAAMVICPGGGYGGLAPHEGAGYAEWLAENGIAGFVLKYRLGSKGYRHPAMINDAARAVRLARSKADEWHIDVKRVGIMGSSAGGHLASTLLTHFDAGKAGDPDPIERFSSRPDIGILCYPVITMGPLTHGGSKKNLLGDNPPQELVDLLSNEKQVTKDTPPTFLFHTWEDKAVNVENSINFAQALHEAGVPFDLHIYQKGAHGMGLGGGRVGGPHHPWVADCLYWLKVQGFVK
jgi:acetyl esterase/lipase